MLARILALLRSADERQLEQIYRFIKGFLQC